MKRFLLLFLSLLPLLFIYAQSDVVSILEKMATEKIESQQYIPLKSMLPCAFFDHLFSGYIGISDIGVDSAMAYKQAYLRALSLASLRQGQVRGLCDAYNDSKDKDQVSYNYEEFYEVRTALKIPRSAIKVKEKLKLATGEVLLFLAIDSSEVTKNDVRIRMNNRITIYCKEDEAGWNHRFMNKITVSDTLSFSECDSVVCENSAYTGLGNRWVSENVSVNGRAITTDCYKTFYELDTNCIIKKNDCDQYGATTVDGLWSALINDLYRKLSMLFKNRLPKEKSVSDKSMDDLQSLDRDMGAYPFDCVLTGCTFSNNRMALQLQLK